MKITDFNKLFNSATKVISRNSPTILTGLSVAGLVATVVMGVKATPKAIMILQDEYDERDYNRKEEIIEPITNIDAIKLTWKCYIPTAIMGTATIACIIGANHISLRRNAALASIYSLTEATLKEYQAKVIETIGETKEKKVRDEIAKDRITRQSVSKSDVIITGTGDVLCYDCTSGRYFKGAIEKIRKAQNDINNDILTGMGGSAILNDLYYSFGLSYTELGNKVGWTIDKGLLDMSFSSQLTDNGEPCLVIDYQVYPVFEF